MDNSIIAEGKTTNEAIENGLKILKVAKDRVNIKVLENEEKRSFFSILAPRVVKVELTLKDNNQKDKKIEERVKREIKLSKEDLDKAEENLKYFLEDFIKQLTEGSSYSIEKEENDLIVCINGEELGYLIGYRGETLYAMQNILSAIASKGIEERVRVILDIEGYKAKREKTLEELAVKVAKTVMRNKKTITLEPMQAYERKIIHSKLQTFEKIETKSIGEEPRRRVVISLKNHK